MAGLSTTLAAGIDPQRRRAPALLLLALRRALVTTGRIRKRGRHSGEATVTQNQKRRASAELGFVSDAPGVLEADSPDARRLAFAIYNFALKP
jgi:hypothetical protein